jgi:hypothetical protein
VDVASEADLDGFVQQNGNQQKPYIVESIGAGLAFLDYDQDGRLDLYLTNGSSLEGFPPGQQPRDALYRNRGGGKFEDVTESAGLGDPNWTNGVAVADYDSDGWPDIYLTNFGPNVLYRNLGNGKYEDVTRRAGVGDPHWSTGASWVDYDGDGDLDLYVANYVDFDKNYKPSSEGLCKYRGIMVHYGPKGLKSAPDTLYRNNGDDSFTDVTAPAGIVDPDRYGFQAIAFDFDSDGDQDIFVANDSTPNFLWRNNGDGSFTDVGMEAGVALNDKGKEQGSMGATVGDYNGDGRLDIFITNFSEDYNTLYRNDGGGLFTDVSFQTKLAEPSYPYLAWGCNFFDFDNDGDPDLFAANGHIYPQVDRFNFGTRYRQKNQLFENLGGGEFREITESAGSGLQIEKSSRGAAWGDYDNDGDLDIAINNLDDRPTLLSNEGGNRRHWIQLKLIGSRSNRDALGAEVAVASGGVRQLQLLASGTSFLSSSDLRLHFGLGVSTQADEVEVRWPRGLIERFHQLPADRLITIEEGQGRPQVKRPAQPAGLDWPR